MDFGTLIKVARIENDEDYAKAHAIAINPHAPMNQRIKAYKDATNYEASLPDDTLKYIGKGALSGAAVGGASGMLLGSPAVGAGIGGVGGALGGYLAAQRRNELIEKAKQRSSATDDQIRDAFNIFRQYEKSRG